MSVLCRCVVGWSLDFATVVQMEMKTTGAQVLVALEFWWLSPDAQVLVDQLLLVILHEARPSLLSSVPAISAD